jgi:hypothetical protein
MGQSILRKKIHFHRKALWLIYATCFLLILPSLVKAQALEAGFETGPVLKIYPNFPSSSGASRYTLSYFPKQSDTTIWNTAYHRPLTGCKISYLDMGGDTLGKAIGAQYFFSQKKRLVKALSFNWGLGLGMVYFTNPYHYLDNPNNIANGSHLAFLVELNLGLHYQLNEHYGVLGSFVMLHSSNGHTTLPNVGTNIPGVKAGIRYQWKAEQLSKKGTVSFNKNWHNSIRVSLGQNEFGRSTSPTNGPKQYIYLLSLHRSKRYSVKGQFLFGLEGYYNSGYRLYLKSQEIAELEDRFNNASALIAFVGHEYRYGHYGLMIQAGYNLHNPFLNYFIQHNQPKEKLKAKLPGKFGVNYYFNNPFYTSGTNFYLGLYIKSNVSQADFLEAGVGMTF